MFSGYLTPEQKYYDARWSGPDGNFLIEVKRTSNARDIRGALLALAYALNEETENARALCVLTHTRFSEQRLHGELARFRSVVRPDLGDRIYLAAVGEDGHYIGDLSASPPGLQSFVMEVAHTESGTGRVSRQAVKAFLVECWLDNLGPQSVAKLKNATGASYPTVVAALADLRSLGVLKEGHRSGALLGDPSWEAWRRLAEGQMASRKVLRFVDPSGQARRPSDLAW